MNRKLEIENTALDPSILQGSVTLAGKRSRILSPFICSVLAAFGIFGGISSLFAGLICVIIHSLLAGDRAFDSVGTVLLIIAIPMILVGSAFLDAIKDK